MFQQGSLDTLCGVYSIIRSVHDMSGGSGRRLKDADHRALFHHLCKALAEEGDLAAALSVEGLKVQRLRRLLRCAHAWAAERTGLSYSHKRAFNSEPVTLEAFWSLMERHIVQQGPSSVIISLTGVYQHWSCISAMSPMTMRLRDSDGLKQLRRSRCTTSRVKGDRHHVLWPTETLLLAVAET